MRTAGLLLDGSSSVLQVGATSFVIGLGMGFTATLALIAAQAGSHRRRSPPRSTTFLATAVVAGVTLCAVALMPRAWERAQEPAEEPAEATTG